MAAFSGSAFSVDAFAEQAFDFSAVVEAIQPILPITAPSYRSTDAKSISDVYNRGTADVADYEFSNRRRFYK